MDFIETERNGSRGERAEMAVWEAVKRAFRERSGVAYRHFPIFSRTGEGGTRKEPDILILDRELGVVVIEVKGLRCEQIERIDGHRWCYRDFYETSGNPYQQGENQLFALFGYTDREPDLRRRVDGRVVVGLPWIHSEEWLDRGLDNGPHSPPVLFEDNLSPASLLATLAGASRAQQGKPLDEATFDLLLQSVSGSTGYRRSSSTDQLTTQTESLSSTEPVAASGRPGGAEPVSLDVLRRAREHLHSFDIKQEVVAKQIAPGPQRIRGIAGSGKTVLLCQKAVQMHLKHPEWDIGLVFFTRSLYDLMLSTVDRWMRRFSQGELAYDPNTSRLQIMHAWGAKDQPGFYRNLALAAGEKPLAVNGAPPFMSPTGKYAWTLKKLITGLEESGRKVPRLFDALLIDEGQDLVFDKKYLVGDRQPFYWLAYETLRPATRSDVAGGEGGTTPDHQDFRRLVWAYDEAQSLDTLSVPTYKEVFGAEVAERMLSAGPLYPGGIAKNEVMGRCYRSPGPILAAAHAIGMGLLRPGGMLYGLTTRRNWNVLGYDVEGEFRSGRVVTLTRQAEATPNIIPSLTKSEVVSFESYPNREEEIASVADNVKRDIVAGRLQPSRDLLVIALGKGSSSKNIQRELAQALAARGVDYFIPSSKSKNEPNPKHPNKDPNAFWHDGAVTVSTTYPAKGNEADVVYILGLDEIAAREDDPHYRNQLFVALTRSRAFVRMTGVGSSPFFDEVRKVLASGTRISFTFRYPERQFDEVQDDYSDDRSAMPADATLPAVPIGRNSRVALPR